MVSTLLLPINNIDGLKEQGKITPNTRVGVSENAGEYHIYWQAGVFLRLSIVLVAGLFVLLISFGLLVLVAEGSRQIALWIVGGLCGDLALLGLLAKKYSPMYGSLAKIKKSQEFTLFLNKFVGKSWSMKLVGILAVSLKSEEAMKYSSEEYRVEYGLLCSACDLYRQNPEAFGNVVRDSRNKNELKRALGLR